MTLNANYVSPDCIKNTTDWGSYNYYDICNHVNTVMPWGRINYIQESIGAVFFAAIIFIIVCVALGIFSWIVLTLWEKKVETDKQRWYLQRDNDEHVARRQSNARAS